VKSISATNERFERLFLKAYVNLGDWYIETSDGNNIVIKDVEAPESKLEYTRNKLKI